MDWAIKMMNRFRNFRHLVIFSFSKKHALVTLVWLYWYSPNNADKELIVLAIEILKSTESFHKPGFTLSKFLWSQYEFFIGKF